MHTDSLPKQADAEATPSEPEHPSIWLYVVLLLIAVGLIAVAFSMQPNPDWAGLLLNIAAGFIGSVVVLVFVDRRLRNAELQALVRLPAAGSLRLKAIIFPSHRVALRYCRSLYQSIEPRMAHIVLLPKFDELDNASRKGFVLRGPPGSGKTTWAQICASNAARRYLAGEKEGRVTILFPLARWLPERSLHQALFEQFYGFAPCTNWTFNRLLKSGRVVVILDGFDELWNRQLPLREEYAVMKEQFSNISWVLTSRPSYPLPTEFGDVHDMPAPDEEQLQAILTRVMGVRRDA